MNRVWIGGAILAGGWLGSAAVVACGRDTSPPAPNVVVLPNVIRPTTTTAATVPKLGVLCTDRQGYPFRAAKCPRLP
jgi:hypothetical protein